MTQTYDYLVVGAGLFGATFAHEIAKKGKRVLVIEKRDHLAGNIYTEEIAGIQVHKFGAQRQGRMGLRQPICGIQPVYQYPNRQLSRGNLQFALQYEHLQQALGCGDAGRSGRQN